VDERVLSRSAARALDRRTTAEHGLPSLVLMENAGRASADEAARMLGGSRGPVLVLCGPGNNGGDGFVVARTLENRGTAVEAVFVGPSARLADASPDFATHLRLWRGLGHGLETVATPREVEALEPRLARAALIVDALFGTGLDRPLGEPWLALVRRLNAARRPVLALDLPSGLDADTGAELGAAVRAACTVTFVARKPGFALGIGPEVCGRVVVAEIGVPRAWIEAACAGRQP
jgi:NAD(P)H-hydrate epimerase